MRRHTKVSKKSYKKSFAKKANKLHGKNTPRYLSRGGGVL